MRTSQELIHDREAWMRKYDREQKQREWNSLVNSWARWKKTLEMGKKLNNQATIDYYTNRMIEAERKFPQLKKSFD